MRSNVESVCGVIETVHSTMHSTLNALAFLIGLTCCGVHLELLDPRTCPGPIASSGPVRVKGLGLTRTADITYAAFCGAIELVIPRFSEAADENGIPVLGSGLFPLRSVVLGS